MMEIKAVCKPLVARGLTLVVVDYLQLVQPSAGAKRRNRVDEITEITGALKALALDLAVPVLALSQLSRAVENRDDKRPLLADLRDSGSIEQDADVVCFLYRAEYYLKQKEPERGTGAFQEWELLMEAARGRAEVIVAKHRHGPASTVVLRFIGSLTKFESWSAPMPPEGGLEL
jgi:replicative DNA helicase